MRERKRERFREKRWSTVRAVEVGGQQPSAVHQSRLEASSVPADEGQDHTGWRDGLLYCRSSTCTSGCAGTPAVKH